MDAERHRSPATAGLATCTACHRPFVVPVAFLDLVDEGLYLLALHCKNCDRLCIGVHEDAELEQLELEAAATMSEIEAAIQLAARLVDDVDGFTRAVEADPAPPEEL